MQIESIRAQTDGDFQCLVQDDASPIEWSEKIRALCAEDSRFVFRRNQSRLGVFHNFEEGLRHAPKNAEFVCYCDQDDIWTPRKLERQRAVLSDPQVMLCHTDLEVIDGQGVKLHPSCFLLEGRNVKDYSLPQIILRNSVTGCTLAFRASLLPRLLPFPFQGLQPRFHHDLWTALCATQYGRIVALPEALVRYRQHGRNLLGVESSASNRRSLVEILHHIRPAPVAYLRELEFEWTRRLEWIEELLRRSPVSPRPEARVDALIDWTQRSEGSLHMLRFVAAHLDAKDPIAGIGPSVLLGRLYNGALRARGHLGADLRRVLDRFDPPRDSASTPATTPRLLCGQSWCRYRELKPLTLSVEGKTVCLFAQFDRDGIIEDYVIHHLSALREAGVIVVLVTTASYLASDDIEKIAPHCAAIIERENIGLDFGSWRTAMLVYPQVLGSGTLLFANDSVYGPMSPLRPLLDRMAATDCDFWGITESLQIRSHHQSYFLGFHRRCLRSQVFGDYCNDIALLSDKGQIIQQYEVGMKERLTAGGLRGAVLVPMGARHENPTLHRWREILKAGAPYLKVQLLRENPLCQSVEDWPDIVRAHGYDPALIDRHLRRLTLPGSLR